MKRHGIYPTVAAALVGLVLTLSGCGIPIDTAARSLPAADEPTSSLPPSSAGPFKFQVFFLRDGTLYPVERYYSQEPTLSVAVSIALSALAIGPNATEERDGITTALQQVPQPQLQENFNLKTKTVVVSLDAPFVDLLGIRLADAYGQVVFTLTALSPEVANVGFSFEGQEWFPLLPNGQTSTGTVGRCSYVAIAPPPNTCK